MIANERLDNVCHIDVRMLGFAGYCSAYLVAGGKVALIDTGPGSSAEVVRAGILKHGFSLKDITCIIISHIHFDHSGSTGILLKEMPKAEVFVHSRGVKHLIDPSIMIDYTKRQLGGKFASLFGDLLPVPASRVHGLSGGEVIDLGKGERLKIIFTPGHSTSSISILEEKNNGIFVGDAPGMYLAKENVHIIPSPLGFDLRQAMESLKMLLEIPAKRLFLGHFGICNTPKEILKMALKNMRRYLDIASEIVEKSKAPEELIKCIVAENSSAIAQFKHRKDGLYEYFTEDLIPAWAKGFAHYYMKQQQGMKA
jgi:glyoxylase-like metal-dependent hydrolase (beta-lactamase superfamily II)